MHPSGAESLFEVLLRRVRDQGRPLILDGAVGTELDNRGADLHSELWSGAASLAEPRLLEKIHAEYVTSRAEVLTTSTFRTTRRAFQRAGEPEKRWREAVRSAVSVARRAAGDSVALAGSVAPLEDCFRPELAPEGDTAELEHAELCRELVEAGVDILWLETFGTLGELRAAIRAASEAGRPRGVPFAVSVTTDSSGNLISGEPLEAAIGLARERGAAAFSVNCIPPRHVEAALEILTAQEDLPFGVYANLGFAETNQDWQGSAHLTPEEYTVRIRAWHRAGASLVGGCCGSTPAHIRSIAQCFEP